MLQAICCLIRSGMIDCHIHINKMIQLTKIINRIKTILYLNNSPISSSNPMPVSTARKDLEGMGDITVGLTEVEIVITGTPTEQIRIQADDTNTGIIFLGKTGVLSNKTNDFIRLSAGDEVTMSYNDATNALYAISDTAGQKINVGALL